MVTSPIPNDILPLPAVNMPGGILMSCIDSATTSANVPTTLQTGTQTTEPFSALLAQQIREINSQPLDTPQVNITIDSETATSNTHRTTKDANPKNNADNPPFDPADLVSAVLLQIPVHLQEVPLNSNSLLDHPVDTDQNPIIKNIPQSEQNFNAISLKQEFNHLDVDLPRQNVVFANGLSGSGITKLNPHNKLADASNVPATHRATLSNPPSGGNSVAFVLPTKELFSDTEPEYKQGDELIKINPQTKIIAPQTKIIAPKALGKLASVDSDLLPPKNDSPTLPLVSNTLNDIVAVPDAKVQHQAIPSTIPANVLTQSIASPSIIPANPSLTNIPQAITARLGSSSWANEFSQKITWISAQQNQTADLQLNPPNLGPLNVLLKISDNQLTAQFISPHSAVRDAVENSLPKLRDILADNNIMLGNTTVSDQAPQSRNSWGFADQNANPDGQHKTSSREVEPAKTSLTKTPVVAYRRHNGILDTFA